MKKYKEKIVILLIFIFLIISCKRETDNTEILVIKNDNYALTLDHQIVNIGVDSNKNFLYVIVEDKENRENSYSMYFNKQGDPISLFKMKQGQKIIRYNYNYGYLHEIVEYKDFDSRLINQNIKVFNKINFSESNILYINKEESNIFTFDLRTYYDYDTAFALIGILDQNNLYQLKNTEDTIIFKDGKGKIEYSKDTIQGILWFGKKFEDHIEYFTLQFLYPYSEEFKKALN